MADQALLVVAVVVVAQDPRPVAALLLLGTSNTHAIDFLFATFLTLAQWKPPPPPLSLSPRLVLCGSSLSARYLKFRVALNKCNNPTGNPVL